MIIIPICNKISYIRSIAFITVLKYWDWQKFVNIKTVFIGSQLLRWIPSILDKYNSNQSSTEFLVSERTEINSFRSICFLVQNIVDFHFLVFMNINTGSLHTDWIITNVVTVAILEMVFVLTFIFQVPINACF